MNIDITKLDDLEYFISLSDNHKIYALYILKNNQDKELKVLNTIITQLISKSYNISLEKSNTIFNKIRTKILKDEAAYLESRLAVDELLKDLDIDLEE